MKSVLPFLLFLPIAFFNGCQKAPLPSEIPEKRTLPEERKGFKTTLIHERKNGGMPDEPPPGLFQLVYYPAPAGKMAAYVSPPPKKGGKHPAIVWLVGGFSNSIGEIAWAKLPPENDQSASAFREEGVLMMYPSLRGGNENPGFIEAFYGEVDDVLAAVEFLSNLDYVDPQRIYLGGHSTGGTLALLAAESSDRFRAVFSFGPADEVSGYGDDVLPFSAVEKREVELRSPIGWLANIHSRTFVMEGDGRASNISSLRAMMQAPHPDTVRFHPLPGATHFSGLAPITRLIARKILADHGPVTNIDFQDHELIEALKR